MKKIETISEDQLLEIFHSVSHPLNLDSILRISRASKRAKDDIFNCLHALKEKGILIRLVGGRWVCVDNLKTTVGIIAIQRFGSAFVTPIEGHDEFFVASENIGEAWNGDTVKLLLLPKIHGSGKKQEGVVVEIINRKHSQVKARILSSTSNKKQYYCQPIDSRLSFSILADTASLEEEPQPGDILEVLIGEKLLKESHKQKTYMGTALNLVGHETDAAIQERITKTNNLIPTAFPDNVITEAQKAAETELIGIDSLVDLRNFCFVTIDGEDAKDFDDAIYVSRETNQWTLLVAIADVSYFVAPSTSLDKEAALRGNSYYFPTTVEPMLPEILCNGVCSLQPNMPRRCMAVKMTLNNEGEFCHTEFINGVIISRARLTYKQVQKCLDNPEGEAKEKIDLINSEIFPMLQNAEVLANVLIERRKNLGGFDFDTPEAEFIIEEQNKINKVTGIKNRQRLFSHKIIEAFMIRANEAVAEFLSKKNIPFLYRVHPEPEEEKLRELYYALKNLDEPLPLPHSGKIKNPKWMQYVVNTGKETKASYVISRLVLRSMMQAKYESQPGIHFGLASKEYCHFTSPIRRYADLMNHRSLKYALKLDHSEILEEKKLNDIAELCNENERKSVNAEREIDKRMGCLLMQASIGQYFSAIISGVTHFGIFAELDGMPIEGFIRLSSLKNDYYIFNEDTQELVGKNTGRIFKLGQSIKVKILKINIEQMEIDMEYSDNYNYKHNGKENSVKDSEKNKERNKNIFSKEKKKYFDQFDKKEKNEKNKQKKVKKAKKYGDQDQRSENKFSSRKNNSNKKIFREREGTPFAQDNNFAHKERKKYKNSRPEKSDSNRSFLKKEDYKFEKFNERKGKDEEKIKNDGLENFIKIKKENRPSIFDFEEHIAHNEQSGRYHASKENYSKRTHDSGKKRVFSSFDRNNKEDFEDNFDKKYSSVIKVRKKTDHSSNSFFGFKPRKERTGENFSGQDKKQHRKSENFSYTHNKKSDFDNEFNDSERSSKFSYKKFTDEEKGKSYFKKKEFLYRDNVDEGRGEKYNHSNQKRNFSKRDSFRNGESFNNEHKKKKMSGSHIDNFFKMDIEEKPKFRFGKKNHK